MRASSPASLTRRSAGHEAAGRPSSTSARQRRPRGVGEVLVLGQHGSTARRRLRRGRPRWSTISARAVADVEVDPVVEAGGCQVAGGPLGVAAVGDEHEPVGPGDDPAQRPAEAGEPADVGRVRHDRRPPVERGGEGVDAPPEVTRRQRREVDPGRHVPSLATAESASQPSVLRSATTARQLSSRSGRRRASPARSRGRRTRRSSRWRPGATTLVWRHGSRAFGLERWTSTIDAVERGERVVEAPRVVRERRRG